MRLFFLDIELPAELHQFKLETLQKLNFGSNEPTSDKHHIPPGGEPIVDEDDIEDPTFDGVSTPSSDGSGPGSPQTYSSSSISFSSTFETTIPHGATIHGFTIFDNLVVHNGTFYLVTNDPSGFPKKAHIAAKPHPGDWGDRDPNPEDFHFITPEELVPLLGDSAIRIQGSSWILYDVWQFMRHFYHWWGEIILGGWRVWSLLGVDSTGSFHPEWLQLPDRFLLPMVADGKWRDRPQMVGSLMRAAFPNAAIEERDQWLDLTRLNSTVVFDRALIINRRAAHAHPWGGRWSKMIAGTQELQAPEFSPESSSPSNEGFWSPIRKTLTHNTLGYLPTFASLTDRRIISPPSDKSELPLVTYIDRQGTGRRLTEESHKSLVDALSELEAEGVCEIKIVRMENVPLREQIRLAARSAVSFGVLLYHGDPEVAKAYSYRLSLRSPGAHKNNRLIPVHGSLFHIMAHTERREMRKTEPMAEIMVGVHGNGLTHQLWMPPSARSTIIEIVIPGAYPFDYEMLARNMGHKHYMAWNDTLITYAKGTYHQKVNFPDDFHSSHIYVHGPAVAQKIKERLLGTERDDAEKVDL
ncbi:hypothetical protein D9756_009425 [Leucocoprinus leucothites]|uniref:Uncharacterized protein n=1 Tax=Leucocoprinus leucothites TaxID=201217 RepID=A0A8H5FU21_9AGAR|nr:hypothetical protein D9756_009425 [Leucoagaricus leucothites]